MAKTDDCKHNPMISCSNHSSCAQCGWNPGEDERRKKYIRRNKTNKGMIKARRDVDRFGRPAGSKPRKILSTNIIL